MVQVKNNSRPEESKTEEEDNKRPKTKDKWNLFKKSKANSSTSLKPRPKQQNATNATEMKKVLLNLQVQQKDLYLLSSLRRQRTLQTEYPPALLAQVQMEQRSPHCQQWRGQLDLRAAGYPHASLYLPKATPSFATNYVLTSTYFLKKRTGGVRPADPGDSSTTENSNTQDNQREDLSFSDPTFNRERRFPGPTQHHHQQQMGRALAREFQSRKQSGLFTLRNTKERANSFSQPQSLAEDQDYEKEGTRKFFFGLVKLRKVRARANSSPPPVSSSVASVSLKRNPYSPVPDSERRTVIGPTFPLHTDGLTLGPI